MRQADLHDGDLGDRPYQGLSLAEVSVVGHVAWRPTGWANMPTTVSEPPEARISGRPLQPRRYTALSGPTRAAFLDLGDRTCAACARLWRSGRRIGPDGRCTRTGAAVDADCRCLDLDCREGQRPALWVG